MFDNVFYTVYKITNLVNSKIYIGAHITDDLNDQYFGSGKLLIKAIEKYGVENFEKEYLVVFNNKEDMFAYEAEIVNEEFLKRKDVYNLKEGGSGGWDHVNSIATPEQKRKAANIANQNGALAKGRAKQRFLLEHDPAHRAKFIEKCKNYNPPSFKGKQHSAKAKKKIGEANSKYQQGKNNSQYGTCWIYNDELKQCKKVKKEELSEWLQKGWCKGRKLKFDE